MQETFGNIKSPHSRNEHEVLPWWEELQEAVPLSEVKAFAFLGNKVDIESKRKVTDSNDVIATMCT